MKNIGYAGLSIVLSLAFAAPGMSPAAFPRRTRRVTASTVRIMPNKEDLALV